MDIRLRDYEFDGKTHWVAVVDGATVTVTHTSLEALIAAMNLPVLERDKKLDPAIIAPSRTLTTGATIWDVHEGVHLILDPDGKLDENGDDLRNAQGLKEYMEHMDASFVDSPSIRQR